MHSLKLAFDQCFAVTLKAQHKWEQMRVCCLRTRPADLSLSDDTLAYLFIHEMTDLSVQTHQDPKSVLTKSQRQVKNWLERAN